jgi:hypothetical protein
VTVTELARRESKVPVAFGVPLRSLDEAYRLSQALAMASSLPDDLRGKPADVLAILLYGQELGLGPMQSIQSIYIVEHRPSLAAQLWRALGIRAGHKIDAESEHNQWARVTVVRNDDPKPYTATYTIDDAIQAGKLSLKDGKPYARSKTGKSLPWENTTDDMLMARATTKAMRFKCPEVALGFYGVDEAQELAEHEADETVADAEPIPQPEPTPQDDAAIDAELVALNADADDEPSEAQLQAFAMGGTE